MSTPAFKALIEKYNVAGPRYTSYPTAVQFKEIDTDALHHFMETYKQSPRAISLYIHLPFCRQLCWYCGCTMLVSRKQSSADAYLYHLEQEMAFRSAWLHPETNVVQVHFGGGTPTFLSAEQLLRLGAIIKKYVNLVAQVEYSVEIDPRHASREQIKAIRAIGGNRASIGVQDINEDVQQAIHRIQSVETTETCIRRLREEGFSSVNTDLVYGLPLQTSSKFMATVEQVIRWKPERIAMYSYAHVPWMRPGQQLIQQEDLPSADEKLVMLQKASERLTEAGYVHIGMDHFALPTDELALAQAKGKLHRNFQGYSTQSGLDLWAFGMSAISHIGPWYLQNHKELNAWVNEQESGAPKFERGFLMSTDDQLRNSIIQHIMCGGEVPLRALCEQAKVDESTYFNVEKEKLSKLEADGLIEWTGNGFKVSRTGRHFLRNIAMCFDRYLPAHEKINSYSKTI